MHDFNVGSSTPVLLGFQEFTLSKHIFIDGFPKSKIGENVVYPFRFTRRHRAGRKIP